jgi:hypothetical protein
MRVLVRFSGKRRSFARRFQRSRNTMNTEARIRHVYERWHEMIVSRDLDGLMALYAEDSVLESSAVLVLERNSTAC